MIHVDHFFTIGQQHVRNGTPCEDYALSGHLPDATAYAALSDGCSGAYARTDLGARGWCLEFERQVFEHGKHVFEGDFLARVIEGYQARRWTQVKRDDMASLVAMVATPERAELWIMGDGGYALQHRDGDVTLVGFEWEGNAPFYPAYRRHAEDERVFVGHLSPGVDPVTERRARWSFANGTPVLMDLVVRTHSFEAFRDGHHVRLDPQQQDLVGVSLFSDGLWSVDRLAIGQVLRDVTAFKNFEGTFVKRRMVKAVSAWALAGFFPRDDLATATARWEGLNHPGDHNPSSSSTR